MDLDSTSLSGTWFRHITAGGDVYYQSPEPADNRWQRGAVVEALYFADSEETAWAVPGTRPEAPPTTVNDPPVVPTGMRT